MHESPEHHPPASSRASTPPRSQDQEIALNVGPDDGRLFPWDTVVGVVDDPDALEAAILDLVQAGIEELSIHVLAGDEGARLIDAGGKRHGLLGRLFRKVHSLGAESEHTARHLEELGQGHFVVIVPASDESTIERVRDVLAAHGGHFVNFYTRWTTRDVIP